MKRFSFSILAVLFITCETANAQVHEGTIIGNVTSSLITWDNGEAYNYNGKNAAIHFLFDLSVPKVTGSYGLVVGFNPTTFTGVQMNSVVTPLPDDPFTSGDFSWSSFSINKRHVTLTLAPDLYGFNSTEQLTLTFDKGWLEDPSSTFNGRANFQFYTNAMDIPRGDVRGYINMTFGAGVPEPSSWAMMIAGCGFFGAGLRRRRDNVKVSIS